jgi:DNA-directed RNA polymerase specialized sigma24 family protein
MPTDECGGRVADVSLDKLLPMFDEHGRHVAPVADWSMTVDDSARQMDLRMVLSSAIAELPADYRVVELLRDVDGLRTRKSLRPLVSASSTAESGYIAPGSS